MIIVQIVVDSFNLKMDSAQHREGWSGSVTDVLGVIKGNTRLLSVRIGTQLSTELRCMSLSDLGLAVLIMDVVLTTT